MKKVGKGGLLLPLGIGAGVLLLLTSMKKKNAETAMVSPEETPALPSVSADEAAVPQVNPTPAPAYSPALAKKTSEDDGSENDKEGEEQEDQSAAPSQNQPGGSDEDGSDDETDESSDGSSSSGGNRSGGSSSYNSYQPSSSINTNRQTLLPAYNTGKNGQPTGKRKPVMGNKSLRFQSDQARMPTNYNPLIVGNGKPRMGPLPVTYRPGATNATQQPIVITSQKTKVVPIVQKQATIFPLRFGSTNPYVKEIQRKLGISPTGYFGTQTRAAIQKRFRVSEISESLYKQIITGKAPVATALKRPANQVVRKIKKPIARKAKIIRRK